MRLHLQSYDGSLVLDTPKGWVVRVVDADRWDQPVETGTPDAHELELPFQSRAHAELFATKLDLTFRSLWPRLH